jgi:integrase
MNDRELSALLTQMEALSAAFVAQQATIERLAAKLDATPARRITVRDLVQKARETAPASTARAWGTGWRLLLDGIPEAGVASLADKWADEVTPSDLSAFVGPIKARARAANAERDRRRHAVGRTQRFGDGQGAIYNAVGAWRFLFRIAESDGYALTNVADKVAKPKRRDAKRAAFPVSQVPTVLRLAAAGSDDPDLDTMLVKFHLVTGARQEGALNLTRRMLDPARGDVVLDEKNDKTERQPVPDWFLAELIAFADERGAVEPDAPVFRKFQRSGTYAPIGRRRYNYLFQRIQAASEFADNIQLSAHTLRHCAGTYIRQASDPDVAKAFLRHAETDVTGTYTKATRAEVVAAVLAVWGGTHPDAQAPALGEGEVA